MGWPARHIPTRRIAFRQCGYCGAEPDSGAVAGAGVVAAVAGAGAVSPDSGAAGGCHAACSSGLSRGGSRRRARTRLARTLAAGCSQPKVRTLANWGGRMCCSSRPIHSSAASWTVAGRPVALLR